MIWRARWISEKIPNTRLSRLRIVQISVQCVHGFNHASSLFPILPCPSASSSHLASTSIVYWSTNTNGNGSSRCVRVCVHAFLCVCALRFVVSRYVRFYIRVHEPISLIPLHALRLANPTPRCLARESVPRWPRSPRTQSFLSSCYLVKPFNWIFVTKLKEKGLINSLYTIICEFIGIFRTFLLIIIFGKLFVRY